MLPNPGMHGDAHEMDQRQKYRPFVQPNCLGVRWRRGVDTGSHTHLCLVPYDGHYYLFQ